MEGKYFSLFPPSSCLCHLWKALQVSRQNWGNKQNLEESRNAQLRLLPEEWGDMEITAKSPN